MYLFWTVQFLQFLHNFDLPSLFLSINLSNILLCEVQRPSIFSNEILMCEVFLLRYFILSEIIYLAGTQSIARLGFYFSR